MKNSSILIYLISICILSLESCSDDPEPLRNLDGDPSGAVINTSVLDFDENQL